jgi:hypothetical protein
MQSRNRPSVSTTWDEMERLAVLARYSILDTAPEPQFDDIVQLASQICKTPVSLISLVEDKRQWFKAKIGIEINETPIGESICAQGILQPDVFIIQDTLKDERFLNNPLVKGDLHLRFYAGVPITTDEGLPLGMMCVLDKKPRALTKAQIDSLKILAQQVMRFLDLRHSHQVQTRIIEYLRSTDERLQSALNGCGIGVWDYDLVNNRFYADPIIAKMLHISEEHAGSGYPGESFLNTIHPNDHTLLKEMARRTFEENAPYCVEYRILNPDGSVRWIQSRGQCHYTSNGQPYRLIGCSYDLGKHNPLIAPILKLEKTLKL